MIKRSYRIISFVLIVFMILNLFPVSSISDGDEQPGSNPVINSPGAMVMLRNSGTQNSTALQNFVSNVSISAPKDSDGKYVIIPDENYAVTMQFAESRTLQFNNDGPLTYKLPDELTALPNQNGSLTITVQDTDGVYYEVKDNQYSIENGVLTFNWSSTDPDIAKIKAANNVAFTISFNCTVKEDAEQIEFGNGVTKEVTISNENSVSVSKSLNYIDYASKKAYYKINVASTGNSKDIVVDDIMTSNGLTINKSSITVKNNNTEISGVTINEFATGFPIKIPTLNNGQIATIEYYADIDLSQFPEGNGRKLLVTEEQNTVRVSSEGDQEGDTQTITHTVDYTPSLYKASNGVKSESENGKTIEWKITANENFRLPMTGTVLTDSIDPASQSVMSYSGTGITVKVTDSNWQEVGQVVIPWENLNKSGTQWAFTIPETLQVTNSSGQEKTVNNTSGIYRYEILYTTDVDTSKETVPSSVSNTVGDGSHSSTAAQNIGNSGGGQTTEGISKKVDRIDLTNKEITWSVSIRVPKDGLAQAVVKDTYPYIDQWNSDTGSEIIEQIKTGTVTTEGLLAGEHVVPDYSNAKEAVFTFYKDAGTSSRGLKGGDSVRYVTLTYKTRIDDDWVKRALVATDKMAHKNKVQLNDGQAVEAVAYVQPSELKKEGNYYRSREIGGVSLPVYKYIVTFTAVNGTPVRITDSFNTEILELYIPQETGYGEDPMTVWGGNAYTWNQAKGDHTVSYLNTQSGIDFTINEDALPMNESGYYSSYRLTYYLTVKNETALKKLQQLAAQQDNGTYALPNEASWNGKHTSTTVEYTYQAIEKDILTDDLSEEDKDIIADFRIVLNPGAAVMNQMQPMTMEDTFTNLSILYDTIHSEPDEGVSWDFSGNKAIFTIPDATKVVITYQARVTFADIGEINQTVSTSFSNTATMKGQSDRVNRTAYRTNNGHGTASLYRINLLKYEAGNMKKTLQGARFELLEDQNGTKVPVKSSITGENVVFESDQNGKVSVFGNEEKDGWSLYHGQKYYLRETVAPNGYQLADFDYEFTISKDGTTDYNHYIYHTGDTMSAKNYPGTDVKAEKTWTDGNEKHSDDSVTIQLQQRKDGDAEWSNTIREHVKENGQYIWKDTENKIIILNQDNEWKGVFRGLPLVVPANLNASEDDDISVEYRVIEIKINNTVLTNPVEGNLKTGDGQYSFTVTNTPDKGSLTINKTVTGVTLNSEKLYQFQITREIGGQTKYYDAEGTELSNETSVAVSVSANSSSGSITVHNLDAGTYTVTELDDSGHRIENYRLTVEAGKSAVVSAGSNAEVSFTNTYTQYAELNLEGMKHLDGQPSGTAFSFDLADITEYSNGTPAEDKAILPSQTRISNTTDGNGKGLFTFNGIRFPKDGTYKLSLTETQLPADSAFIPDSTEYELTVIVEKGNAEVYNVSSITYGNTSYEKVGSTNTFRIYKTNDATFKNTTKKGKLIIKKNVNGEVPPSLGHDFTFTLTKDGKWFDKDGAAYDTEKTITVSDTSAEGVTINNLPLGTYTLTETNGNEYAAQYSLSTTYAGLTDLSARTVTFSKTSQEAAVTVTNTYTKVEAVPFVITGIKTLDGETVIPANEFRFKVTDETSYSAENTVTQKAIVPTANVGNDASGKFTITGISFPATGTYQLKVEEISGSNSAYIYDSSVYHLTINVEKNGSENKLIIQSVTARRGTENAAVELDTTKQQCKITQSANKNVTFANITKKGSLKIIKNVTGGIQKDHFTFTLTDSNGKRYKQDGTTASDAVITVPAGNTGITVKPLPLGTYTLQEDTENAKQTGYSLSTVYTVGSDQTNVVTFKPDDAFTDGITEQTIQVSNTYTKYRNGSITLFGTKKLEGKDLKKDDFEFTLTLVDSPKQDDSYTETVKNGSDGTIQFTRITYDTVGDYVYQITEKSKGGNGISTDNKIYSVTVRVSEDITTESLKAVISSVTYRANASAVISQNAPENKVIFTNRYKVTPTQVTLEANKTLNGAPLKDKQFTFELKPAESNENDTNATQSKTNNGSGEIKFDTLNFSSKGTYLYTIRETSKSENGIKVDDSEYQVTVTVTDNGLGQLNAKTQIKKDDEETDTIEFVNEYSAGSTTAVVKARKSLAGRTIRNGEFTFSLTPDGTEPNTITDINAAQTVTNKGEDVIFAEMTYKEAGTYWYKMKETTPGSSSMTVDTYEYWAKVSVVDSGSGELNATVTYHSAKDSSDSLENGVTFTNTYVSGSMKLKKTVTGNKVTSAEKKTEFEFTLVLKDKETDGKPVAGTFDTVITSGEDTAGTAGTIEFNPSGVAKVNLKHGQEIQINGLPNGAYITVSESPKAGYQTNWKNNLSGGTINNNTILVLECKNKHDAFGNMTVKKVTFGNAADSDNEFQIKLEFWKTKNKNDHLPAGTYGKVNIDGNGYANISFKNGQTVTAENLPYGTYFEVREHDAGAYTASATVTNGKTVEGVETTVTVSDNMKQVTVNGVITDDYTGDKILYITIENTKNSYGGFSITKKVKGNDDNDYETNQKFSFAIELSDKTITGEYGDIRFKEGQATVELGRNETKAALGLDNGIVYTITEADYSNSGFTSNTPVIQGTVIGTQNTASAVTKENISDQNRMTAKNTYTLRGRLSVTKVVDGNQASSLAQAKYHVTVTLGDTSINGQKGGMTFNSGVASFDLQAGQTVTASDILHGTTYTVTEGTTGTILNGNGTVGGYTTVISVNGEDNKASGTIDGRGENNVVITNRKDRFGGLKIEKETAGSDPDKKTWFAMKIELSDKTVNGQYGDVYFINGLSAAPRGTSDPDYSNGKVPDGYVKVTKETPLYIRGLPAGITYQVTEDSYEGTYDKQEVTNGSGTILELASARSDVINALFNNNTNSSNVVTYTNTRNRTGKLVIRKALKNTEYDPDQLFHFTITMKQKDGSALTGTYDGVEFNSSGTASLSLHGDEEKVITGLPLNATFNVVEEAVDGYLAPEYTLSYKETERDANGDALKDTDGKNIKTEKTFSGTINTSGENSWSGNPVATIQVDQRIVTVTNTISQVEIAKVDFEHPNVMVPGAKFQILQGTDVKKEWISSGSGDVITGLKTETEYILREEKAPNGYKKIGDIHFKIGTDGKITLSGNTVEENGTTKTIATIQDGKILVKNEKNYKPELEKYVNKDVHADLQAFDETFTYDLIAFVTGNADVVEITDMLKESLEFAPTNGNVKVTDLGTGPIDHTVNGSVKQITGTDITQDSGVQINITGRKLTVTLSGERVTGTDGLRDHYVKITFDAVINQKMISSLDQYNQAKTVISDNTPVLDGADTHTGIDNTADYRIKVGNKWAYKLTSNTVTVTPPTIKVKVEKKWTDKDDASITWPEGAVVKVILQSLKAGKATDVPGVEPIELNSGKTEGTFENLPIYQNVTYTVREEVTGIDQRAFDFILSAPDDSVSGIRIRTYTITNKAYLTSVSVKKVWIDENNSDGVRPTSILVTLLADGVKETSVSLNAGNGWQATVENLPKTQKSDRTKEIKYTWEEETVPGYTLAETITSGNVTMLVNTHTPELIEIPVRKVWDDSNNAANKRPESVTVQLFADGTASGPAVTLSAANEWKHTWADLQKNAGGKAIAYTVEEIGVPDGYEASVSGNASSGFTVTNTFQTGSLEIRKTFLIEEPEPEAEPEWREITVNKIWNDSNNADGNRPASVTVRLYAGAAEVASAELTEANGWSHTFMGLLKEENGVRIRYTVYEDPVAWYTSTVRGFTITNTYQPQTTSSAVTKVWHDEDNKGGFRPKQVVVTLRRNGNAIRHLVLSEKNHWTAIATGLPTMVNGEAASYTWTEEPVVGYEVESSVTRGDTTTITNKLWERPPVDEAKKPKKAPGDTFYIFEEYETPLGVEVMINHVGDCFD